MNNLLHENQSDYDTPVLSIDDFMQLLFEVRIAEGYDIDQMPKIFQEALLINKYGFFSLEELEDYIKTVLQEEKVVNY